MDVTRNPLEECTLEIPFLFFWSLEHAGFVVPRPPKIVKEETARTTFIQKIHQQWSCKTEDRNKKWTSLLHNVEEQNVSTVVLLQ
mmetsp:Transcript_1066/g.2402  ORF Transcript_1066/g.2402 Transcript_1066/m.2402 type:complete len:85 (+) Transcript_1066:378-632(+)